MTIHLEPSQVPAHLRSLDPSTRKFRATPTTTLTIPADAGVWYRGTKYHYEAVELATGRTLNLTDTFSAPWDDARTERHVQLKPGYAVVKRTIFQGKNLGLEFFVHPDNIAALLPAPSPESQLTPVELFVLYATKTYKANYNGRSRYQIALDDYRYSRPPFPGAPPEPPTTAQINTAITVLIELGYLTKSKAITPKGRNAAP